MMRFTADMIVPTIQSLIHISELLCIYGNLEVEQSVLFKVFFSVLKYNGIAIQEIPFIDGVPTGSRNFVHVPIVLKREDNRIYQSIF